MAAICRDLRRRPANLTGERTETVCETTLGYDETGVWREDRPGARMHLPWDEMTCISGYKLDCITRVDSVLEFEHESGHFLEFNDSWSGFDDVVNGVSEHFELPPDWFALVTALSPPDGHVVVWQRPE